jgi:response regulator of citrate/malate metabolism
MIRVLVVDDDFRVASVHAAYVEKVPGFIVVGQAHSAQAFVVNLETLAPDLVLLDLYLPDQHGLEVLKRLRQARSGASSVDVIVITAASDADSVRTAMQFGAFHYLLKPFGFVALQERLLAYQAMHRQLGSLRQADQLSVDRIYSAMSGTARAEPKSRTLEAVEQLLAELGLWLTAVEVAAKLGTSRATAQRYLSRLEASGKVVMALRYGTTGRPEHRYRHHRAADVPSDLPNT